MDKKLFRHSFADIYKHFKWIPACAGYVLSQGKTIPKAFGFEAATQ